MVSPIDLKARHAVGFAVDGSISAEDLKALSARIDAAAGEHDKIRLYAELREFDGFSGISQLLRSLRLKVDSINKVEKYALVVERGFFSNLTTLADYVTPNMTIKVFDVHQADVAQAWLVNDEPEPAPPPALVQVEYFNEPGVVAVALTGKLHSGDYKVLNKMIADHPESKSLFFEIREIKGLSLKAIVDDLKTSVRSLGQFKKMAIVGWQSWLPAATKIADWVTPGLDVRYFDVNDVASARLWLGVAATGADD